MDDDHKVGATAIVAIAVVLLVAMFMASRCNGQSAAAKSEACKAVMASSDERARLLSVGSGGACQGLFQ